jgi:small subunit ribosomal protein S1
MSEIENEVKNADQDAPMVEQHETPTVEDHQEVVAEAPAAEPVVAEVHEEVVAEAPAVEAVVAEVHEEVVAETPAVEPVVAAVEAPAAEAPKAEQRVKRGTQAAEPKTTRFKAPSTKAVQPVNDEDFDWEAAEGGYSKAERAKLEDLYKGTLSEVKEGEIVTGIVVYVTDKDVILNIGFKSEGIVPLTEFREKAALKPGDKVDVYLETVEDANGQLILSRKRAKHMRTWEKILKAETEDVILEGLIKRRTKGGFVVDIDGIEAFLPGSQIDVKPVRDFDAYVGKSMDFKVVKINHPFENVVISHKVLIEKDLEQQRMEILKNLEKGQVLEGTVKNMTHFGVFIDLGGVDGLLHITDISWGRINHPDEVLDLDQKVNVVVLEFDEEKKRISLGMKQLQPHPWDSLADSLVEGSRVKGRVVTVADYGIFVEITPGVEGLVHMSEMSWSQHLKNPTELFKIGDEVEATILSIDRDEHKMSLGLKQSKDDPWLNAAQKFAPGTQHAGIVRNMTNYGLFVELEEGVDGLVHISDLSWTKKYSHPSEFIKKDEKLEVVVLDIDVENRRLSLGHKQLTEDVWITFEAIFVLGSTHKGTLLSYNDKGGIVELEYGVEGFVPSKHMAVAEGAPKLKTGEAYEFKVIEFNKDAKKLVLSHRATWDEESNQEQGGDGRGRKQNAGGGGSEKSQGGGGNSGGGNSGGGKKQSTSTPKPKQETTTLGEISALANLKAQLEADERQKAESKLKGMGKGKAEDAEGDATPEDADIAPEKEGDEE